MADFAVAPGYDGRLMLHRADCPEVRMQAKLGEPVMTLYGCEVDPRELDLARHDCLVSAGDGPRQERAP